MTRAAAIAGRRDLDAGRLEGIGRSDVDDGLDRPRGGYLVDVVAGVVDDDVAVGGGVVGDAFGVDGAELPEVERTEEAPGGRVAIDLLVHAVDHRDLLAQRVERDVFCIAVARAVHVEERDPVVAGAVAPIGAGRDERDLVGIVVGDQEPIGGRVEAGAGGLVAPGKADTGVGERAGSGELVQVDVLEDRHLVDLGVRDVEPILTGEVGDARRIGARRRQARQVAGGDEGRRSVDGGEGLGHHRRGQGELDQCIGAGGGLDDEQTLRARCVGGVGRRGEHHVDRVPQRAGFDPERLVNRARGIDGEQLIGEHVDQPVGRVDRHRLGLGRTRQLHSGGARPGRIGGGREDLECLAAGDQRDPRPGALVVFGGHQFVEHFRQPVAAPAPVAGAVDHFLTCHGDDATGSRFDRQGAGVRRRIQARLVGGIDR